MINEMTRNDPLDFLQPKREAPSKGGKKQELGQSSFIKLMVAQMKNQDPTKPLDPNQFMSQLAQFSTVNGILELQKTVESVAQGMVADQSVRAAGLVGHEVLAEGGTADLATGGSVAGVVQLDASTSDLTLKIYGDNGALVRTLPMGSHQAGRVPFQWDGFADDGAAARPGRYRIVAEAADQDGVHQAVVALPQKVESVAIPPPGGELELNLSSGATIPLSGVQEIL